MSPPTYSPPALPMPRDTLRPRSPETDSAPMPGTTECRGDQPCDVLSAEIASALFPRLGQFGGGY